jgi:hypothetical protein
MHQMFMRCFCNTFLVCFTACVLGGMTGTCWLLDACVCYYCTAEETALLQAHQVLVLLHCSVLLTQSSVVLYYNLCAGSLAALDLAG